MIVHSRKVLEANFSVEAADIVEVPYAGGGWAKFAARTCDKFGIDHASIQILVETISDRALEKPLVLYVGNAQNLLRDEPEELLRFVLFWEALAFSGRPDDGRPMFLALQMSEPRYG